MCLLCACANLCRVADRKPAVLLSGFPLRPLLPLQCRCCGGVFCAKCTTKAIDLASMGLPAASEKDHGFNLSAEDVANSSESRVCDWCYSVLKLLPPLGLQAV